MHTPHVLVLSLAVPRARSTGLTAMRGSISAGDRRGTGTCNVIRYLWIGTVPRWASRKSNVIRYKRSGATRSWANRECNVIRYLLLGARDGPAYAQSTSLGRRQGLPAIGGAGGDQGFSLRKAFSRRQAYGRQDGRHDGPQAGSAGLGRRLAYGPRALQAPATLGSISAA